MGALLGVALGGVLAILGGVVAQGLQGRRERLKWLAENRRNEYRELLTAITKALLALYQTRDVDATSDIAKEAYDVWNESIMAIHTRLFIANEIQEAGIYDRWAAGFVAFQKDKDSKAIGACFQEIRKNIVDLAIKDP